jgi:hypothetical protein
MLAWLCQLRGSLEGSAFMAVTAALNVVMMGSDAARFWMFRRVGRFAI